MALTSVGIIALALIALSVIKILVLLVKPQAWMSFAKNVVYKKPAITKLVAFVLGGIILYYLLMAGITVVQILAVAAFVAMLFVFGLSGDVKHLLKRYEDEVKKGIMWKKYWFYTLLWVALIVWGVLELAGVL